MCCPSHNMIYPSLCLISRKPYISLVETFVFQGAYFAWKATAMGKNFVNGKTFLEKR